MSAETFDAGWLELREPVDHRSRAHGQSEELARQLLVFNRRIPPEEIIAKVDAVDAAAIRRVGKRLLNGAGPTLAAIGPLSKLPSLDSVRAQLG